jgi:hypothetical protein
MIAVKTVPVWVSRENFLACSLVQLKNVSATFTPAYIQCPQKSAPEQKYYFAAYAKRKKRQQVAAEFRQMP